MLGREGEQEGEKEASSHPRGLDELDTLGMPFPQAPTEGSLPPLPPPPSLHGSQGPQGEAQPAQPSLILCGLTLEDPCPYFSTFPPPIPPSHPSPSHAALPATSKGPGSPSLPDLCRCRVAAASNNLLPHLPHLLVPPDLSMGTVSSQRAFLTPVQGQGPPLGSPSHPTSPLISALTTLGCE